VVKKRQRAVNVRNSLLCLCIALTLCGCAHLFPPQSEKPGAGPSSTRETVVEDAGEDALAEVVVYAQRAAQFNAEEQKREVATLTQAIAREKGERATVARIRLAILLSQPGAAVEDDARAQTLLEPYANAGVNASLLRQFGAFLHSHISERIRGARRADQLKDQLDQLRAVERSIIERGQKPPVRKP
jgi:hypothetical protein